MAGYGCVRQPLLGIALGIPLGGSIDHGLEANRAFGRCSGRRWQSSPWRGVSERVMDKGEGIQRCISSGNPFGTYYFWPGNFSLVGKGEDEVMYVRYRSHVTRFCLQVFEWSALRKGLRLSLLLKNINVYPPGTPVDRQKLNSPYRAGPHTARAI